MTTLAPPLVRKLARDWEENCGLRSAQLSGIVGDAAHGSSGYHISRQDCDSGDYSVVRPDDKGGPSNMAAAIDMTMSASDMRLCTQRLVVAYSNVNDPRRKYLNAFNGTLNNTSARRWDVYARVISSATSDHLWHVHLEIRRKYVESTTAMAGILAILQGQPVEKFLVATGVRLAPGTKAVAPAYPGVPLKKGMRHPAIGLWQARMLKRGWASIGKDDGVFGEKTLSVVIRWQDYLKIIADGKGVIGPKTWPTPWERPVGK